jgi:hypothetical protein
MTSKAEEWALADRISDRIVNMMNEERLHPDFSPVQALAGQLLALLAMLSTAPMVKPLSLGLVEEAVGACLHDLFENHVPSRHKGKSQ